MGYNLYIGGVKLTEEEKLQFLRVINFEKRLNAIDIYKHIENKLDELNGKYGNKQSYCIFCKSTEYNGSEGIVHYDDCIIKELRVKIKKLNANLYKCKKALNTGEEQCKKD